MSSALSQTREKARADGVKFVDAILASSREMMKNRDYLGENRKNTDSQNLQRVEKIRSRNVRSKADLEYQIDLRRASMHRLVKLGAVREKNNIYEASRTGKLNPDDKKLFESYVYSVNMYIEEAHNKINGLERDEVKLAALETSLKKTSGKTPGELVAEHGLPDDPLYARDPLRHTHSDAPRATGKRSSDFTATDRADPPLQKKPKKGSKDALQGMGFDTTVPPFGPLQNTRSPSQYLEEARRAGRRSHNTPTENTSAPRRGR